MQTVGRNDPCPCGSGRKFKHCCGRIGEGPPGGFLDPSGSEPEWLVDLKVRLQGQDFSSLEELQAATDEHFNRSNRAPKSDFHGLSAEQMHRVLHFPFDSPDIAEFNDVLPREPVSPFSKILMSLLKAIDHGNMKPTKLGFLPRPICLEIADLYRNEETFPYQLDLGKMRRELDFMDLYVVRKTAEMAGLIRKYKGRFILSRKCRTILDSSSLQGLYSLVFRTFCQKFNWGYRDAYPEEPFIQNSFLFTLFLLTKYGSEWRMNMFYEDQFVKAFPLVIKTIPDDRYITPEETVRNVYTLRVLCRFIGLWGLADVEEVRRPTFGYDYRIRASPLLTEMIAFHV